jgi:hypothetical protein
MHSPIRENPNQNADDNSERTITQGSQGAATTNRTTEEDEPTTAAATTPIPSALEHVIYKVRTKLHDLIPAMFINLADHVEDNHRKETVNALLEASLKTKATLNMAKALENDMAIQSIVAPENMKSLVNSLVDQRIESKSQQAQKELTKEFVKEARKKSLGGAPVAKTPPGKHGNGGKPKNAQRSVSFGSTPKPAKRAKKANTKTPEYDHALLKKQRQHPNPYRNDSSSGRGFNPGRGRGRGRGRGGSSRGRGRGRGRF